MPAGKNDDRAYYLLALKIVGDFGATIAIPAVLGALLGTRLDAAWHSRPFSLIACLLLAFSLTAVVIRRKAAAYGKEYQALIKKNA